MQPLPKFLRQTQAWSAQWAQLAELLFTVLSQVSFMPRPFYFRTHEPAQGATSHVCQANQQEILGSEVHSLVKHPVPEHW